MVGGENSIGQFHIYILFLHHSIDMLRNNFSVSEFRLSKYQLIIYLFIYLHKTLI